MNAQTNSEEILAVSAGETFDAYPHVVVTWKYPEGKATRIVECRAGIQWIIQHFTGSKWRNFRFCRNRGNLLSYLPGKAEEIRAMLPERFPEAEVAANRKAA